MITAREHKVLSEIETDLGGTYSGLLHGELLIGSLGTCQLIVAKLYAKRLAINSKGLSIEQESTGGSDANTSIFLSSNLVQKTPFSCG